MGPSGRFGGKGRLGQPSQKSRNPANREDDLCGLNQETPRICGICFIDKDQEPHLSPALGIFFPYHALHSSKEIRHLPDDTRSCSLGVLICQIDELRCVLWELSCFSNGISTRRSATPMGELRELGAPIALGIHASLAVSCFVQVAIRFLLSE